MIRTDTGSKYIMYYVALLFFVSCFHQRKSGLNFGSLNNVEALRVEAIDNREVAIVNSAREGALENLFIKVDLAFNMKSQDQGV